MFRQYFVGNIILLSLVLSLAGCATDKTYHLYEGDPLPPSDVATIKPWRETRIIPPGSLNVWPATIDGQVTESYRGSLPSYYLLPGEHKIRIGFNFSDGLKSLGGEDPKEMVFNAEAGHLYLTKTNMPKANEIEKGQIKISFWIEDASTNEVVAGTRLGSEE